MKDTVLSRIEESAIEQVPRWVFLFKNFAFWAFWAVSILVGAGAVAAILFSAGHVGWEFYEATHANILTFLIETLPYFWIVMFLCMLALGNYNLRQTKTGYRYSLMVVGGVSIVGSLLLGFVLFISGTGAFIELTLGDRIPFNRSVVMVQRDVWRVPEAGRLIGTVVGEIDGNKVLFEDVAGDEWMLVMMREGGRDRELLAGMQEVRLLGYRATSTASGEKIFHVCIVLPGPKARSEGVDHMIGVRKEFTERTADFKGGEINEDNLRSNECGRVRPKFSPLPE